VLVGLGLDRLVTPRGRREERDCEFEAALGLALALEQPVAKLQRGDTVLFVVALDRFENARIAGIEPSLKLDDRFATAGDLALAGIGHEELTDGFDRVVVVRNTERPAHNLKEIHECLTTKQLVNFLLASRVESRQPLQRRRLVV
jgi:hypothetical protein